MRFEYANIHIEYMQSMLTEHKIHMEVIQTSKGVNINKAAGIILPSLRLSRHHQDKKATLIFRGITPKDEFLLIIPLDGKVTKINGLDIANNGLNIAAPNELIYILTDNNATKYTINIRISKQVLEAYLGKGAVAILTKKAPAIRGKQSNTKHFIQTQHDLAIYVNNLIDSSEKLEPQAIKEIEETIYHYIINLLSEFIHDTTIAEYKFNNHLVIIKRVMEILDSSPSMNMNKSIILKHTFCSARTLDYAFQSILGLSYKKYVILRRMHLIKKELLHSPEQNIKSIVRKYGIVNVGRFSRDFYLLFGQYPKQIKAKRKIPLKKKPLCAARPPY